MPIKDIQSGTQEKSQQSRDIEDFRGYALSDGLTKQPPKGLYVPNMFRTQSERLGNFQRMQKKGKCSVGEIILTVTSFDVSNVR